MKKIFLFVGIIALFSQSVSAKKIKIAGTVNGIKITVKEANKALKQLSKDKKSNWDTLPDEGKIQLIQMLAPSKLIEAKALKSLTRKEKDSALANIWMQKKMSKIKISDKEAKRGYAKLKKMFKQSQSKRKIPSFKSAKNSIKMQLAQEKILKSLLKKARIRLK